MFADTIGHGVSCVYLKNPLSGIFCAWHVIKYFTNLTQVRTKHLYFHRSFKQELVKKLCLFQFIFS